MERGTQVGGIGRSSGRAALSRSGPTCDTSGRDIGDATPRKASERKPEPTSDNAASSLCATKRKNHEQHRTDILSNHSDEICNEPRSIQDTAGQGYIQTIRTVLQGKASWPLLRR